MSDSDTPAAVEVRLGRCDEVRAEVFVRVAAGGGGAIEGTLTGPQRGRDTTLPATARLQPTATPDVARAIVTEPAYWTPDLPNLYRLRVSVATTGGAPVATDRLIGLRRLGIRGRSLWLDGHRWVPRAVRVVDVAGIDACKPAALAALVAEPDEALLARADALGVAVLALVSAARVRDVPALADRIATWAAHPSVALVILSDDVPTTLQTDIAFAVRSLKGTLLLAATVPAAQPAPATIPTDIDALVVGLDAIGTPHGSWRPGAAVPLIAWRSAEATPQAGRAPCDTLQAALAAWGTAGGCDTLTWDWAGYIIG